MAHAHDVKARDALADIGMDALEVVENGFLPIGPVLIEKELAVLRGGAFGKSPVKSPDGAVHVGAQALMHGINIAERGGIQENRVPGWLGASGIRVALEREIG